MKWDYSQKWTNGEIMCEVTIVMPNYEEKSICFPVKGCIESQTEKKILILDNASRWWKYEEVVKNIRVECVMLDKNYGFCRAVKYRYWKTDTPYVILLNNDTVIKDNYVKYLRIRSRKIEHKTVPCNELDDPRCLQVRPNYDPAQGNLL